MSSAGLLITASTGFGAVYAWSVGSAHGLALGALTVALAIGLEIAKPLSLDAALTTFGRFNLIRGVLLSAMGLVAVLYSVTAELSLVSLLRGTSIAERSHTETTSENLKSRRKDLLSEKASLPVVRPHGIVAAEIGGLEATPGLKTCDPKSEDYGRASRKVCPKLAALKTELATATRLAEIDKEVSEIDGKLSASGPVLSADPGAASIVAYGKLLGFTLDVKAVSELLTLVPVLALELGSALALVLVRAITPTRNAPEQAFPVASPIEGGTLEGIHDVVTEQGPEARLLEYLRANGGTVETGQRTLAKAVGLSTTRLNGLLKSMAEVGRLKLDTSSGVTVLTLA